MSKPPPTSAGRREVSWHSWRGIVPRCDRLQVVRQLRIFRSTTSQVPQFSEFILLFCLPLLLPSFGHFFGERGRDFLRLTGNTRQYLLRNSVSVFTHSFAPFFGLRLHPEQPPTLFGQRSVCPAPLSATREEGTPASNHQEHAIYHAGGLSRTIRLILRQASIVFGGILE